MRNRSQSMFVSKGDLEDRHFIAKEQDATSDEKVEDEQATTEWTARNEFVLVNTLSRLVPKSDNMPYDERLKKIDWKRIAFDQFDEEAVKAKFQELLEKTRTYRLLKEILADMSQNIFAKQEVPFKPKSAFILFLSESKKKILKQCNGEKPFLAVASNCYKNLSDEKKEDYVKRTLQLKENFQNALNKFNTDSNRSIKGTKKEKGPIDEYYDDQFEGGQKDRPNTLKKDYASLPKEQKLSLILKWANVKKGEKLNRSQYEKAKQVLTKNEMAILDEYEGKPHKPANGYCIFLKEFYKNSTHRKPPLAEARSQWQKLPLGIKKQYLAKGAKAKKGYQKYYKTYINSLPMDRLQSKNKNKIKKRVKKHGKQNVESKRSKDRIENYFISDKSFNKENNVSAIEKAELARVKQTEDTDIRTEKSTNQKENEEKNKRKQSEKSEETSKTEDSAKMEEIYEKTCPFPKKRKHISVEASDIEGTSKKQKTEIPEFESQDIGTTLKSDVEETSVNTEKKDAASVKKSKKKKKEKAILRMEETNIDDNTTCYENQKTVSEKLQKLQALKPPKSCYNYFKKYCCNGLKKKPKSQYEALSPDEKKRISNKYKLAKRKFLENFQTFANSLSAQELEENEEAIGNILHIQSDPSDASVEES